MVWPFNRSKEEEPKEEKPVERTAPKRSSQPKDQKLLLEDTQPRFNNGAKPNNLPIKEAITSIKTDDFKFGNLVSIPCFRTALLTGISSMGVLGTMIFIFQKSPRKASNWAVGGFFLGSTFSWEQCRYKRRKEFEFAEKARETVARKQKPMMNNPTSAISDAQLEAREEMKKSWWRK